MFGPSRFVERGVIAALRDRTLNALGELAEVTGGGSGRRDEEGLK